MATTNMQMQTFLAEPMAFAANQRDEVRDLHDVAAALGAQPGMKQQTFVAGIVSKGNGDCFLTPDCHTALTAGGGQAGQGYAAFIPGARMIANSHLEQGISLRDLVTLGLPDHDVYLVHQTADVGFIPAADLASLTDQGKAQFAPLLDARVASIKQGAYGVEVALTGIEPELLTCYDQAVADSQRSTHALEYFM